MVSCLLENNEIKVNPAKLHGFFKFSKGGFPTPSLIYEEMQKQKINKKSAITYIVNQHIKDERVYAVVECTKEDICLEELFNSYIMQVQIGGNIASNIRVVPISSIHCPLMCIPNFGCNDSENMSYFISSGWSDWGTYFSHDFYQEGVV